MNFSSRFEISITEFKQEWKIESCDDQLILSKVLNFLQLQTRDAEEEMATNPVQDALVPHGLGRNAPRRVVGWLCISKEAQTSYGVGVDLANPILLVDHELIDLVVPIAISS